MRRGSLELKPDGRLVRHVRVTSGYDDEPHDAVMDLGPIAEAAISDITRGEIHDYTKLYRQWADDRLEESRNAGEMRRTADAAYLAAKGA